jgi:hypothetical protein
MRSVLRQAGQQRYQYSKHCCMYAVLAVQLDNLCDLHLDAAGTTDGGMPVTGMLRLIAALALFCEGLAGVYIPVLLRSVEGYEW